MEKKRWSLILMALCLALALTSSPVEAQICARGEFCDRDGDQFFKDHRRCVECLETINPVPDCDDSDNSDENNCAELVAGTTFSVDVVEGTGEGNWVVTDPITCEGSSSSSNLGVHFPNGVGCGAVMVTDEDGSSFPVFLSQISVRNTKKGATARAFFSSSPCCPGHTLNEFVYATDNLLAMVQATDVDDASFEIDVGAKGVNLTKLHQPDKGDMLIMISIGRIVYTAIP